MMHGQIRPPFDLKSALLAAFATNDRINRYLIEKHLGRSVGGQAS